MEELAEPIKNRQEAIARYPDFPWLSLQAPQRVEAFLRQRNWLAANERVLRCEKPGDGNMNLTLRVTTDLRSFIVKQARPWVEKYDHIAAPWDRAGFEQRFYERVQSLPDVASRMPRLLHADLGARVLVLEDLGNADPLTCLYGGESLAVDDAEQLAMFLNSLHNATRGDPDPGLENRQMRELNYQHVFEVPMSAQNGIHLEEFETGLTDAAKRLREDAEYRTQLSNTGQRYLDPESAERLVLLHGDFFPGSWLRTAKGIFVIDPEFCFYGDPEFDLGCAVAHFALAGQPRDHVASFLQRYADGTTGAAIDSRLLGRYAAAETMRRLIGVAQLPLETSGRQRGALLARSHRAMLKGTWEELWS